MRNRLLQLSFNQWTAAVDKEEDARLGMLLDLLQLLKLLH